MDTLWEAFEASFVWKMGVWCYLVLMRGQCREWLKELLREWLKE
jgi:hypothetical protein